MVETIFQRSFSFLNGQSNAQVIGGYSGLDWEEYVESYSLQDGLALDLSGNRFQKGFNFILDGVALPYTVLAYNLGIFLYSEFLFKGEMGAVIKKAFVQLQDNLCMKS